MENSGAIQTLSALAQETRLDVFRLLVKHEPDGLPAGEIAHQLGAPHNTLSSHLAILTRAGLIEAERQGRSIIYRANLGAIGRLVGFLTEDCCRGRPEACAPLAADLARHPRKGAVHE